jgi:hypothetical protein
VPSQSELDSALLTAAEVGPGFRQQPTGSGIGENSLNKACGALGGGASPSETAIRAFVANPDSTSIDDVTEELLQFTTSQAETQLDQFAQVVRACPSISVVIPTSIGKLQVQIGLADEAFSATGDQTAAIRVTADVVNLSNVTVSADIVAVRHGGTVLLVVNAALNVDSGLTRSVVAAAYEKVAARW